MTINRWNKNWPTYFTQTTDNVGDEEWAPAEKEDTHDDPDSDGPLVFLHQAVAHLLTCTDLDDLWCSPLYLLSDQASLYWLLRPLGQAGGHPGQKLGGVSGNLLLSHT